MQFRQQHHLYPSPKTFRTQIDKFQTCELTFEQNAMLGKLGKIKKEEDNEDDGDDEE